MGEHKNKQAASRRSALQQEIMKVLLEAESPGLRNAEIAQVVDRHHSSVSRALKRLLEQGVVQRDGHRYQLTEKGSKEIRLALAAERQRHQTEAIRRRRLRSIGSSLGKLGFTVSLADQVMKAVEPFRGVIEMSSMVHGILWQQKEIARIADGLRSQMLGASASALAIGKHVSELERLVEQFALPQDHLACLDSILSTLYLGATLDSLPALAGLKIPEASLMLHQHKELWSLIEQVSSRIDDTNMIVRRIVEPLAPIEALLQRNRIGDSLARVALGPHLAYQKFAFPHLERAAEAPSGDIGRKNRLSLLDAGAALLPSIVRGFELGALTPMLDDATELAVRPDINVFTTLDEEIEDAIDLDDPNTEVTAAVEDSMTAKIVEQGQRLVQLVYDLNQESKREGRGYLFEPTNKGMLAFAIITSHVANDHDSFHVITDFLYFLLYEGSGEAKRLLALADDKTLTPLWQLKHLRRDSRHDTDVGNPSEARRKSRQIGEAYKSLIGRSIPKRRSEWRDAQYSLYERIIAMLERIWYRDL